MLRRLSTYKLVTVHKDERPKLAEFDSGTGRGRTYTINQDFTRFHGHTGDDILEPKRMAENVRLSV